MRFCISFMYAIIVLFIAMCSNVAYSTAQAAENQWYWISSDDNYSKYFDPKQVKVVEAKEGIATRIKAVTRTTYSYGGAKETLDNYGLKNISPDKLAYSIAAVQLCPQDRTLAYISEVFFDKEGKKLWDKRYSSMKHREINSQQFDEDFYAHIVDEVFDAGEVERSQADDRWFLLRKATLKNGGTINCMVDTTTIRMNGENIIFWEWQEIKNEKKAVTEIRFLKRAINLKQYTGKILTYQHWNAKEGWQDYTEKHTDGVYHAIKKGSTEAKELETLKVYEARHKTWVHRYTPEKEKKKK